MIETHPGSACSLPVPKEWQQGLIAFPLDEAGRLAAERVAYHHAILFRVVQCHRIRSPPWLFIKQEGIVRVIGLDETRVLDAQSSEGGSLTVRSWRRFPAQRLPAPSKEPPEKMPQAHVRLPTDTDCRLGSNP